MLPGKVFLSESCCASLETPPLSPNDDDPETAPMASEIEEAAPTWVFG